MDEENAQAGSRALAASGFQANLAIVGEPTQLQVITAHKGSLWLELTTRGVAAHGATPQLGKNAVHAMARVVDFLETEYAAQLRRRKHPLLGAPTVNVGRISGGTQPNIVPEACVIAVDRRTLPGETDAQVMREIAARLRKEHPRMRFIGHFDKLTMHRGEKAMREEFERLLPTAKQGGFIISVDHQTPPAVSYRDYQLFMSLFREYAEKAGIQ